MEKIIMVMVEHQKKKKQENQGVLNKNQIAPSNKQTNKQ